ncbi:hypothetical protein SOVF_142450 [Spinacia oleracea]|nr:hypothetical protein SOVF_142450 [Spinacia oleracea]
MLFVSTIISVLLLTCFPFAQALVSKPATMLTAANPAKQGCQSKCGNLTIPYPFGIGKDCAMGDDYIVMCITKNGTKYAAYWNEYSVILNITETELTMESLPVAQSCDGETLKEKKDLLDDTCSGLGCCEAPIPKGLQNFDASLEKIVYNTSVSSGNCSYAFIAKRSSINFIRAVDLQDPGFASKVDSMPSVLDWFIANATCIEAQKKSSMYACQQNTTCIDLDKDLNVYGYRCKCLKGYEGNPYLKPGCTDTNECKGLSNPCSRICVNTPGHYECHCPKGYQGDGKKDGSGCLEKSMQIIIPVGIGIGLGSILLVLGGYWLLIVAKRRKKIMQKAKNFERNGGLLLKQQMSTKDGMIERISIITAEELEKATDYFNEDRVLGQGGQDVAGALTYLHSASSMPIFHRDIKTSNILLDAKYRAKLSDFGTSRYVAVDQTHLTTSVQGTFGYLDPEYFRSNQFTEKSDVYGFGVVLVELLTGKRAVFSTESHNGRSLVLWFLLAMEDSNFSEVLAARVANEGKEETIRVLLPILLKGVWIWMVSKGQQ